MNLHRIRWAVRAVGGLAIAVSVFANILHAEDNPVSQGIAAWPPIALVLTVDLISRVPVHSRRMAWTRRGATAVIAGIAAWVSYWHMAAVASRYGETGASPYLLPLSVDGLVVVSFICLVELGGRIGDAAEVSAAVPAVIDQPAIVSARTVERFDYEQPIGPERAPHLVDILSTPQPRRIRAIVPIGVQPPVLMRFDYDRPIGPERAPQSVDRVSTDKPPARKPQPSSRERIERAHKRTPSATNEHLAERLNLSTKTVQRWRPARVEDTPATADKVNGREPEFAAAD